MKNSIFVLSIILLLSLHIKVQAQAPKLSSNAKISLITGTPGDQLYNCFGHSAIRIQDPQLKMDFLYNYGTFDFDTPNFYLKFVQRKLLYSLSKSSYKGLVRAYQHEGRGIYEQEFLLNTADKQALFDRLHKNYQPENREYLYDFFYDNCATRIRDILQDQLGDQLVLAQAKADRRFRSYLDEYLAPSPWIDLGIDIILGLEADRKADIAAQMFLPDYLADNLSQAQYKGAPLLGEKQWLLDPQQPQEDSNAWGPFMVMTLIFFGILGVSWLSKKRTLLINVLDTSLFSILSLAALLVAFLWWGTDHIATQYNLSLFWANPLYHLWIFVGWKVQTPAKWVKGLAWILLGSNLIALLMFVLAIQLYNIALLPVVLAIILRLYHRMGIWGMVAFPKSWQASSQETLNS